MTRFFYEQIMSTHTYIHERPNWTEFYWNQDEVTPLLRSCERALGHLFGRLEMLGFDTQMKALAENITEDVVRSSEIEGIALNTEEVRSSVARHLGIDALQTRMPSRGVDAIVAVMLRATHDYASAISHETLLAWQAALFESGFAGGVPVEVGTYRSCEEQIVSGAFGREKVHYVAPSPDRVMAEMDAFIRWFNNPTRQSELIRSAIAHLWLVSIHPFEDGNGRMSRLLAEICLARADQNEKRFYSIAAAINQDKRNYYRILEQTQCGSGDITTWLVWYLQTLLQAVGVAEQTIDKIMDKSVFWTKHAGVIVSERQRKMLNIWLDGYDGKIMSRTWAHQAQCSSDTATRDLQDLVSKGLLLIEDPTAKRYVYVLNLR